MYYKDAGYWHGKGKFVKENASEILNTIVRSDNHIARNLSFRAQNDLKALDESIAFFIELLQLIYKKQEEWQRNSKIKASVNSKAIKLAIGVLLYLPSRKQKRILMILYPFFGANLSH
jgi:hypothetical protein